MGNKKESIKPNEVAAPTLFVGVGGTGCKIVKKVADLCAPEEKENINSKDRCTFMFITVLFIVPKI